MKLLAYLIIPAIILIIGYTIYGGSSDENYLKEVEQTRNDRIKYLRTSPASPFANTQKGFKTLSFFPVSPDYRVNATLERITSRERVNIANSDGSSTLYSKFAYAHFTLHDQPMKLLILKPAGFGTMEAYFTGFTDSTTGEETYGGGRYLDLEIGKSDKVVIDFNLAYNPYCAYNGSYQCPVPPAENYLPVAVRAGEKDYGHQ